MGLAASQARYLSLSARKTNVEYEGQQINQQRLNLSNQSADLFNQMLTMSVPTPPSSSDFTKLQYSWTDGDTSSVIDNYYQIGTIDDEFNYVVSSYHYENVYTGQRKVMSDPQVQAKKTNHFSDKTTKNFTVDTITYNSDKDTYSLQMKNGFGQDVTALYRLCDSATNKDTVEELDFLYDRTTAETDGTKFTYNAANDEITYKGATYTKVDITDDAAGKEKQDKLIKTFGAYFDSSKDYYACTTNGTTQYICKDDVDALQLQKSGTVLVRKEDTNRYFTDGSRYIIESDLRALKAGDTMTTLSATNNPTWTDYSSVGNSTLTLITEENYKNDPTINIAIKQIEKDMKAGKGSQSSYEHIKDCFDDNGNYIGGLYQFKVSDKTYFTTAEDLDESLKSAYAEQSVADNSIDSQQTKLSYYDAVYVNTKISEVKKAMMETDGQGRFTTVKFEDDSVVYTLNVETIKDEDAYNDAMNQYYYKKEQYDKQVADINAKTEIIQAQDRQLELKLEQLNTEQSALQTEMEACQKVVSKNIDNSFKTFNS